jgi:hypothetical protein
VSDTSFFPMVPAGATPSAAPLRLAMRPYLNLQRAVQAGRRQRQLFPGITSALSRTPRQRGQTPKAQNQVTG